MELGIGSIVFTYDSILKRRFKNSNDLLLHSIEKTLNFVEDHNFKVCEIILDPPEILLSEKKQRFIELCNDFSSIKKQIHAPYTDLSLCTHNPWILKASIECYSELADLCREIDARVLTIHPGGSRFLHHYYNRIKNQLIDSVSILLEKINNQNFDIFTCLENMPKMMGFFLNYQEINQFFTRIGREDIFFTWDTGHSWSCKDNIEKLWEKIHKKIKNIHLVEDKGNQLDIHPTLGEGNVNFKKVFELAETYNYKGAFIMELHKAEDLPKSIENIRNFF